MIIKTYAEKKVLNWIQLTWEKVLKHWKLSLLTNWIYFLASGRTNVCIKVKYPSTTIKMNLVPFCFWADLAVRAVLKISAQYLLQSVLFGGQNKNWRPRICIFEITRTIYSNSERSEEFFGNRMLIPGGFSYLINWNN